MLVLFEIPNYDRWIVGSFYVIHLFLRYYFSRETGFTQEF